MAEPSGPLPTGRNRRVVLYGHPVLRLRAVEVESLDDRARRFLADLKATMLEQDGLGLAGNQLGEPVRAFAIDPRSTGVDREPYCVLNPRVLAVEGRLEREEGCLSLPGIYEVVTRPEFIRIAGIGEDAKPVELEATGLLARAFAHEIDHLDGRLFVDHLSKLRLALLGRRLADLEERESRAAEAEAAPAR
ncbi:MAG TPA: peptide deformylase [candidate division WOR-3 bacterium]|uniref:Peptide deformylase n=1 Tax=candidate division WOR-3 bacterium TaxID=2052148 RepID=A0A7V0T4Q3_UNCW3|nr:peptide deformylase [candidate division WOR-3 bacterium]